MSPKKKTFRSQKHKIQMHGMIPPPINMKQTTWMKNDNDNLVITKLRSNPTKKNSQEYELKAKSFSSGTIEQFILWKHDLINVIMGQNITRPQDKFVMARRLLHGNTLAVFERAATEAVAETDAAFTACMKTGHAYVPQECSGNPESMAPQKL